MHRVRALLAVTQMRGSVCSATSDRDCRQLPRGKAALLITGTFSALYGLHAVLRA
jgi:hypothetical protein